MFTRAKLAIAAGLLALGVSFGAAQAMPISNLAIVETDAAPQQTRWVCNQWGRCWWRPRRFYRPYAYVPGPRFYFGGPRFYGPRHRYGWRHRW